MKPLIVRTCLAILNSHWINGTPCKYAFVGNIDAFSYEHLKSEESQRPGVTVKQIISESESWRARYYRKFAGAQ